MLRNSGVVALATIATVILSAISFSFSSEVDAQSRTIRDSAMYKYQRGEDLTEAFSGKSAELECGVKAGARIRYDFAVSGSATVSAKDENGESFGVMAENRTQVIAELGFKKSKEDDTLKLSTKYESMILRAKYGGQDYCLMVSGGDGGKSELTLNGESVRAADMPNLPNPSKIKDQLKNEVGFGKLDKNLKLHSQTVAAGFGDNETRHLPQKLFSPLVLMHALFPGVGEHTLKSDSKPITFDASLSVDSANGNSIPYTFTLTFNRVYGFKDGKPESDDGTDTEKKETTSPKGPEFVAASFTVSAKPAEGASFKLPLGDETFEVTPPSFTGAMEVDLKRGLITLLNLEGSYKMNENSKGQSVSGSISLSAELMSE